MQCPLPALFLALHLVMQLHVASCCQNGPQKHKVAAVFAAYLSGELGPVKVAEGRA